MMPVVLVIIIAVAWIVILGPNLLKRHGRAADGISSISHFHHQLRVLEHSGPQPIVAPAYRLRGIDGSAVPAHDELARGVAPAPVLTVVGADQLPRPALAFLGADPLEAPADRLTEHGPLPHVRPAGSVGTPTPALGSIGMRAAMVDPHPRQLARRRRRDTLGVLATVFVATGMIGFIPGAGPAWMVTALSGAALMAYVALLVHLRRRAEERGSLLHHMEPVAGVGSRGSATIHTYSVPTYRSGRYAHPSSQAAAAH
jgi:hypothetical protein